MDKAFFSQATGCATQSCGVKDGLSKLIDDASAFNNN
jgi:hypothetical protein